MKKFNSQICTTKEQSRYLLKLGLKPETADMSLMVVCGAEIAQFVGELNNLGNIKVNNINVPNEEVENIPAWSLHRLMEIGNIENVGFADIKNAYETCISVISSHIKFGLLNKEYLKQ